MITPPSILDFPGIPAAFGLCLLPLAEEPPLNAGGGTMGRLAVPRVISLPLLPVSPE